MRWNEKSSRAFRFLTENTNTPKVVRVARGNRQTADALRRIIESEGWAVQEDSALFELLSEVDVPEHVSRRLNDLIAEVLLFCYELDASPLEKEKERES